MALITYHQTLITNHFCSFLAAQRLEPIYNELRELVKDSYYVMADETPHPVLESVRKKKS